MISPILWLNTYPKMNVKSKPCEEGIYKRLLCWSLLTSYRPQNPLLGWLISSSTQQTYHSPTLTFFCHINAKLNSKKPTNFLFASTNPKCVLLNTSWKWILTSQCIISTWRWWNFIIINVCFWAKEEERRCVYCNMPKAVAIFKEKNMRLERTEKRQWRG